MAMTVPNPYSVPVEGQSPIDTNAEGLGRIPGSQFDRAHIAQGIGEVTNDFTKALDKWQLDIDKTRAQDAANQLQEAVLKQEYDPDTGWHSLTGKNALERPNGKSLIDETSENLKGVGDSIRSSLGSPRQRALFDEVFKATQLDQQQKVSKWLVQQNGVYRTQVANQSLQLALQSFITGGPEEKVGALAVARQKAEEIARITGKPVDYSTGVGVMHSMAIDSFADSGNIEAARQYLAQNSAEMSASQLEKANKAIEIGQRNIDIDREALMLYRKYGTDNPVAAMNATMRLPRSIRSAVQAQLGAMNTAANRQDARQEKRVKEQIDTYLLNDQSPPPRLLKIATTSQQLQVKKWEEARAKKALEAIQKQKNAEEKDRKAELKDYVGFNISKNSPGFTEIKDFKNPDALNTLDTRVSMSASFAQKNDLPVQIFTQKEQAALKEQFDGLAPQQQAQLIQNIIAKVGIAGPQAMVGLREQAKDVSPDFELALGAAKMAKENNSPNLLFATLAGRTGEKNGKYKLDTTVGTGALAAFTTAYGDSETDGVRGVFMDNASMKEAAQVLAYAALANGTSLEETAQNVFGDVGTFQNKKIFLPKGMTENGFKKSLFDYRTQLQKKLADAHLVINGKEYSTTDFNPLNFPLQNTDDGRYVFLDAYGAPIRIADPKRGNPVLYWEPSRVPATVPTIDKSNYNGGD